MSVPTRKKLCFVNGCDSSDQAGKVMISVPHDQETRKKWLAAAMLSKTIKGNLYCCEDHFELEQDAENWVFFKTLGARLKMKSGVIPHFNLNTPRKRKKPMKEGGSEFTPSSKQRKATRVESFKSSAKLLDFSESSPLLAVEVPSIPTVTRDFGSTSTEIDGVNPDATLIPTCGPCEEVPRTPFRTTAHNQQSSKSRKQKLTPKCDPCEEEAPIQTAAPRRKVEVTPLQRGGQPGTSTSNLDTEMTGNEEEGIPARRTEEGSKRSRLQSTLVPRHILRTLHQRSSSSESISSSLFSSPTRAPSLDSTASLQSIEDLTVALKELSWKREALLLPLESRFYLGLPKQHYILINECAQATSVPPRDVMIVFKKIRTNDQHERLALDFGLTQPRISQIFNSLLPRLSSHLSHFIFWPSKLAIVMKLPLQFRSRFSNVESIIDGFEIQIRKPTSPKEQALTWSEYKKCNTIKYLLSCTPLGFINFVSEGYGGRITDSALVEKSGYLDHLPNGSDVLADRGFKQIERLLVNKNCTLFRPPSVVANEKLSGDSVKLSKIISSVRIHVERVISRIREFAFLGPHSQVDLKLVGKLDHAVVVACAVINLQDPIL